MYLLIILTNLLECETVQRPEQLTRTAKGGLFCVDPPPMNALKPLLVKMKHRARQN